MSQCLDKRRQLVRWQRSIDIAVTFCQLRREIIATHEHLQGASPPDEPWQPLRRAATRNEPNRHLWLAEDSLANCSKTHVHGQRDLTPSAPGPSFDFGNGYLRHVPEPLADHLRKTKAARMGHDFGSGSNPAQTRVGYEEIRKRTLQNHNPDALIGLEFPAELVEFLRQNFIKKIYRRVIDADECDPGIKPEPETFVIRISHGSGSISVTVLDGRSVREKTTRRAWGDPLAASGRLSSSSRRINDTYGRPVGDRQRGAIQKPTGRPTEHRPVNRHCKSLFTDSFRGQRPRLRRSYVEETACRSRPHHLIKPPSFV